uniref:Chromatin assembly factor 1 subunit A n=1 Tax=Panagrellus redivivus TaxID=6233 RepID=A0A7E4V3T1_PANRE
MASSPLAKKARLAIGDDDHIEAASGSNSSQELKENDVASQPASQTTTDAEIMVVSDADDSAREGPRTPRTPGGKRKLEDKKAARALREAQKQKEREERAAAKQREKEERQRKALEEKEKIRLQREKENEERRRRKLEDEELVRKKRIETQLQKEELKKAKVQEELERLEKKRQEEAEKLEKKRQAEQAKREEEERKNEEALKKEKLLKRQSNLLMNFVVKKAKPEPKLLAAPSDHWLFRPLEKKENMEMAQIHSRPPLTDEEKEKLLTTRVEKSDYLEKLKRPNFKRNPDKVKLFQFHENYRPPYYGTWRKTSTVITGRNPFATLEPSINYEEDSDAEWENDEEGDECVSEDEEEDDGAANSDNEDDGFIVEHGYLSNDEGLSEDEKEHLPEETDEERKVRLAERAKQWKEEQRQKQRRHKTKELKPNNLGPMYLSAVPEDFPQLIEGIHLTYVN